jgi:hypothetical protein
MYRRRANDVEIRTKQSRYFYLLVDSERQHVITPLKIYRLSLKYSKNTLYSYISLSSLTGIDPAVNPQKKHTPTINRCVPAIPTYEEKTVFFIVKTKRYELSRKNLKNYYSTVHYSTTCRTGRPKLGVPSGFHAKGCICGARLLPQPSVSVGLAW